MLIGVEATNTSLFNTGSLPFTPFIMCTGHSLEPIVETAHGSGLGPNFSNVVRLDKLSATLQSRLINFAFLAHNNIFLESVCSLKRVANEVLEITPQSLAISINTIYNLYDDSRKVTNQLRRFR